MKRIGILSLLFSFLLCGSAALAHSVGTSYLRIDQESKHSPLQVRLDLSLRDMQYAIGLDADGDGQIVWGEVIASMPRLTEYVSKRLSIVRGDKSCALATPQLAIDQHGDGPYAVLTTNVACTTAGPLSVNSDLLFDLDDSHRSLLSVVTSTSSQVSVLTNEARQWLERKDNAIDFDAFARFVAQGVWHIWIGFDHIAFLMLLLLAVLSSQPTLSARPIGRILKVITAFTVAHSTTLASAAFGYINLPSRLVEAAIAASIVMTGVANLSPRADRFAVGMAFGFGLIHGFGFASALAELTADTYGRLTPLLGFNLGVELGQLAIVAVACGFWFALRSALRRSPRFSPRIAGGLVTTGSLGIAALGMFWLLQRTLLT